MLKLSINFRHFRQFCTAPPAHRATKHLISRNLSIKILETQMFRVFGFKSHHMGQSGSIQVHWYQKVTLLNVIVMIYEEGPTQEQTEQCAVLDNFSWISSHRQQQQQTQDAIGSRDSSGHERWGRKRERLYPFRNVNQATQVEIAEEKRRWSNPFTRRNDKIPEIFADQKPSFLDFITLLCQEANFNQP